MKTKFCRLAVIRGQTRDYCSAKAIMIFLSAFLSVLCGFFLFIIFLKAQFPWKMEQDSVYNGLIRSGAFRGILRAGRYGLYYAAVGVQLGILAGNLALFSALMSLYVKNRLLVYTVPVISLYFLANAAYGLPVKLWWMDLYKVYISSYNVWNNDALSFLWALLLGAALFTCLKSLILRRVKGELEHE